MKERHLRPSLWSDEQLNAFGVFNVVGFSKFHFNWFLRDPVIRREYVLRRHRYFFMLAAGCWRQRPRRKSLLWQWRWFRLWIKEGLSRPILFFGMNSGPMAHDNCCNFQALLAKENL